jgi:hypothetical protein
MKKKLIIINAFPNNENKIKILQEQLSHFQLLKYPILMVSGCDISKELSTKVDYLIINKENEGLTKKFNYEIVNYCHNSGTQSPSKYFMYNDHLGASFYTPKKDNVIAKNMKLSFNLAKQLGFNQIFYTEDDNIFEDVLFIERNLNLLEKHKIIGILSKEGNKYKKIITTFFFSDVDFFLEKFKLPSDVKDWYLEKNISKYSLYKIFEGVFYDLLKDDINLLYNIKDETEELEKSKKIKLNVNYRGDHDQFIIDNFFNVFESNKGKQLFLYNNKNKQYNISIFFDNTLIFETNLIHNSWYIHNISTETKQIKLIINNKITKTININENIKYNGYINIK